MNTKVLNAILIFAVGFAAGKAYASRDIDRRCNEIVEQEIEAFRAFQEENQEKEHKRAEKAQSEDIDEPDETCQDEENTAEDSEVESDEKLYSRIIQKSEYGMLDYGVVQLELFGDMTVEDTYGNPIDDPEEYMGIEDLHDLFDSDDQTVAYVQNDRDETYFEVIRDV